MNLFKSKKWIVFLIVLNQLCFLNLLSKNNLFAEQNTQKLTSEYIKNVPDNNFYILGPGDEVRLEVKEDETPELNMNFIVNGEGVTSLKRLKRIYVEGLTISELTQILNKEYSKYVKDPDVELTIISYKPVRIYIDGEVEQPGMYVIPGSKSPANIISNFSDNKNRSKNMNTLDKEDKNNEMNILNNSKNSSLDNNYFFPSIIDALRTSGGVTMYANLKEIKVIRFNSLSKGGGEIFTKVNILDTLDLKDSSQNLRILDGDKIFIPKNNKPVFEEISKAIKSNINPKFIRVFIAGRVEKSGAVFVSKNSTLVDAVDISGGTKVLKGKVRFLRYENDGSLDKRDFRFDYSSKRGSYKNPYLRDGDTIYFRKSNINIVTEVLNEVTAPLQGIVSSYASFKIITD